MDRVIVAEDHPLFRSALASVAGRALPNATIVSCATLEATLEELARDDQAMVLLDLKLPDAEGFSGMLEIKARHPNAPLAVVSGSEDSDVARNALVFGASGFIPKSACFDVMVMALQCIAEGKTWTPNAEASASADPSVRLTPAQARILAAMQHGSLNKQIAHEMGVSEATVKGHITIILRKLGVTNRTQAVLVARRAAVGSDTATLS